MQKIFALLYKFDIPDYDIDGVNEFSLQSVINMGSSQYALKIRLNGENYILFTADSLSSNRYLAEQIDMADKLKFIKPKGVKNEYLINAYGEDDYYVRSDLSIDFGSGSYSLAQVIH